MNAVASGGECSSCELEAVHAAGVDDRPDAHGCDSSEHGRGGDQKCGHDSCRSGDDPPHERAETLRPEQDHLVDGEATPAHPGGEEELKLGVDRREEGHPPDTCQEQNPQDHDLVGDEHPDGERNCVQDPARGQQRVDREPGAGARQDDRSGDGAESERPQKESVAVGSETKAPACDEREQRPERVSPDALRVMVLGDCNLWGHTEPLYYNVATVMEGLLSQGLQRPVEVMNMATTLQDAGLSWFFYDKLGRPFKPDVVVYELVGPLDVGLTDPRFASVYNMTDGAHLPTATFRREPDGRLVTQPADAKYINFQIKDPALVERRNE